VGVRRGWCLDWLPASVMQVTSEGSGFAGLALTGCVAGGGYQSLDVVLIETGDGVVQVDGDASGEAGRQFQDPLFSS